MRGSVTALIKLPDKRGGEVKGAVRLKDNPLLIGLLFDKRQLRLSAISKRNQWPIASTAIPGVFPPVEREGRYLVDEAVARLHSLLGLGRDAICASHLPFESVPL